MSLLPKSSEEIAAADEETEDVEEGEGGKIIKSQSVESVNENLIKVGTW